MMVEEASQFYYRDIGMGNGTIDEDAFISIMSKTQWY